MANCCEYSFCDEVNTIQHMRDLVNASRVTCVTVGNGTSADTCCGVAPESSYAPKYSELTAATPTAQLRVVATDPSNDKNGFVYTAPSDTSTTCCPGTTKDNGVLSKSQVAFETTSATSYSAVFSPPPSYCNLSYKVKETKEWRRDRYQCDGTSSGITNTHEIITTSGETSLSGITRRVKHTVSGNTHIWTCSFSPSIITFSGNTTADCSEPKTGSISYTMSDYSFSITVNCIDNVPCEGGDYTIVSVDSNSIQCDDDLSLRIEYNNVDNYSTSAWTRGDASDITVSFGKNEKGLPNGSFTISATTWGEEVITIPCTFSRSLCEFSPTVAPGECGPIIKSADWSNTKNVKVHDF